MGVISRGGSEAVEIEVFFDYLFGQFVNISILISVFFGHFILSRMLDRYSPKS